MKILILGANGMLGNACIKYFNNKKNFQLIGAVRSFNSLIGFSPSERKLIISDIDMSDEKIRANFFVNERPDVVLNCIGIVKQASGINEPMQSIRLNALLPHELAASCAEIGARLIHISTDCVFSGRKNSPYLEDDPSDAVDLYGKTKFLGEIKDRNEVITLRTSYIGNELKGANGLLEWFLAQKGSCQGYTEAIYSGVPTVILARVIESIILEHPKLSGLYQVAATPISKYNLLMMIAKQFKKEITIIENSELKIDRSLDGSLFCLKTGFIAPSWDEMIEEMYLDRMLNVQK